MQKTFLTTFKMNFEENLLVVGLRLSFRENYKLIGEACELGFQRRALF